MAQLVCCLTHVLRGLGSIPSHGSLLFAFISVCYYMIYLIIAKFTTQSPLMDSRCAQFWLLRLVLQVGIITQTTLSHNTFHYMLHKM